MSSLDPQLQIDTPENVLLETPVAGFGSRSLAAIVDYLLVGITIFVLLWLLSDIPFDTPDDTYVAVAFVLLVIFALFMFYHLIFEAIWNGQTPGKRLFKIRVVQANGMPLTASGLIVRNLVRLFDFLPAFYGVGMIVMFASRHSQRLGDLAAGTLVVREQPQETVYTLRAAHHFDYLHVRPTDPIPDAIDVSRLTDQDRMMVLNYLQRRDSISGREPIAIDITRKLATKMDIWDPNSAQYLYLHRAEEFLEQIMRAYERAERPSDTPPPTPTIWP
ncbi:RDD family protein [Aggregatilinea lenta]|uniref:RDD family protein n=1 Tax=Aggregatilinea lenta TaxID=913108 RepID=UPI000E5A16C5|nr:RDD family protein [Aggregatilinea lenta]